MITIDNNYVYSSVYRKQNNDVTEKYIILLAHILLVILQAILPFTPPTFIKEWSCFGKLKHMPFSDSKGNLNLLHLIIFYACQ